MPETCTQVWIRSGDNCASESGRVTELVDGFFPMKGGGQVDAVPSVGERSGGQRTLRQALQQCEAGVTSDAGL